MADLTWAKDLLASWKLSLAVLLSCLFFLFLPEKVAAALWLVSLRHTTGPWVGVLAVFTFAALAIQTVSGLVSSRRDRVAAQAMFKEIEKRLKGLQPEEQTLMLYCFLENQQHINVPWDYGPAMSLMQKELLVDMGGGVLKRCFIPDNVWLVGQEFGKATPEAERKKFREGSMFEMIQRGQTDYMAWRMGLADF